MFIVKESENGVTYTSKYISTQNESSVEYTLSSNKVISVQCSLCEAGTISNIIITERGVRGEEL